MRKPVRLIVLSISIIAIILSILWFIFNPGYEPAITTLVGIAGLIGSIVKSKKQAEGENEVKKPFKKRKKILFIDDDLLKTRFDMLESKGYRIILVPCPESFVIEFGNLFYAA